MPRTSGPAQASIVDRVVVLLPDGGIAADGPPDVVFARYGDALAEQGVWVPGRVAPPRPAIGPPGEPLLAASGLGFRHARAAGPALSDVDLLVRPNEALAVVGPNGSGKTTLALLIGGLLRPTAGTVRATAELAGPVPAGAALARRPPHRWRARDLASRIGSVFQDPEHQFLTARVDTELALGPRRAGHSPAAVRAEVDGLLGRLRLDHLAAANPRTLSGGEQRRLSVATALATAPRVLVLDEPTFGQDRRTWLDLLDLLAKLRDDGGAVVTVTHDADFVAALADRTVRLARPDQP